MSYDSADRACTPQRHSAPHLARNEGRKDVVVLVGYPGLTHGVNPDVSAANTGNRAF
jgi:hypothetical protein